MESIVEDAEVKASCYRDIEAAVGPDVLLWSSTEVLSASPHCPAAILSSLIDLIPVRGYDQNVPRADAFVDEVANELATWPGVSFERGDDRTTLVRYEQHELGRLYPERGVAEIPVLDAEHDELIEHGDAEPGEATDSSSGVSHDLRGPSDVTAVLDLFDRRYRDLRGDDDPYSSSDPS
jgi:hypothetical protein